MNGQKKRKKWEFFQDEWNNIHPCNQKNTLELSSFRADTLTTQQLRLLKRTMSQPGIEPEPSSLRTDTLTTKQLRLVIRTMTQRGIEPEPSSLRADTLTKKQPRLDKQTKLPVQHLQLDLSVREQEQYRRQSFQFHSQLELRYP